MPVFYTRQVDPSHAVLEEEESRHVIRVLRMAAGDPMEIVDGKGNLYRGNISVPDPRACQIAINDVKTGYLRRDYYLHIAIAPPKSTDRFEWFLEKATEIGVDEITPVICERSERDRIRYERSQKILIAAMKQCGRALLPRLNREILLVDFLDKAAADIRMITHCGTATDQRISAEPQSGHDWIILIGPEGDFTPGEIQTARQNEYREISLGEAVYRTETAGIMACHTISLLYQHKSLDQKSRSL
jgi:16S rRNA (uracil1498-N3)-methyltransferase